MGLMGLDIDRVLREAVREVLKDRRGKVSSYGKMVRADDRSIEEIGNAIVKAFNARTSKGTIN